MTPAGLLFALSTLMNNEEITACVRILTALARADGDVVVEEETAIGIMAAESETDLEWDFDSYVIVDVEREATLLSPESRRAVFEAALVVASIDVHWSPEEHALLARIRDAFGITDAFDLTLAEEEWFATMRGPRNELEEIERDFLH